MSRNGASHAAAPLAIRDRPCRAKSADDLPSPEGRDAGKLALTHTASAPAAFNAGITNGSSGMHAEYLWFPRLYPPCRAAINPKEQCDYPTNRTIAQGLFSKTAIQAEFSVKPLVSPPTRGLSPIINHPRGVCPQSSFCGVCPLSVCPLTLSVTTITRGLSPIIIQYAQRRGTALITLFPSSA